ncbi:MFS transporter [Pyrodictium delaneyi]|uniref:MFS transporter n=1 Tax=Pyrodictium delaneyi TaxID=1273541 RepID=A0A211YP33_9CREN|nr:hypothetical protein Pdsh_03595 [Pyrodictium delaneyi]
MDRRALLLAALQALHVSSWSAYYALTRKLYNDNPEFLVMLAAAETLPTAVGMFGALLAEKRGYHAALALGILEGLFLAMVGVFIDQPLMLWLSALLASLFWSTSGPQILGYTMTLAGGSGTVLGLVLAGSTLGWSIGGALAPLLSDIIGASHVMIISGIITMTMYLALILLSDNLKPGKERTNWKRTRFIAAIALLSSLVFTGTEIIGSLYMAKLSVETGSSAGYAAANAATGLVAAAVRPAAGSIIDRVGENFVLAAGLAAYTVYIALLSSLHGLAFVLVWLVPIYPFVDTSLYKLAARLLGDAMGSAVVSSSYSITGLVLLAAARIELGESGYTLLAVASFQLALVLSIILSRTASRWQPHGRVYLISGGAYAQAWGTLAWLAHAIRKS